MKIRRLVLANHQKSRTHLTDEELSRVIDGIEHVPITSSVHTFYTMQPSTIMHQCFSSDVKLFQSAARQQKNVYKVKYSFRPRYGGNYSCYVSFLEHDTAKSFWATINYMRDFPPELSLREHYLLDDFGEMAIVRNPGFISPIVYLSREPY